MTEVKFQKVTRLPDGNYDCEIKHPELGWIPFTASKDDVELHGRQLWEAISRKLNR